MDELNYHSGSGREFIGAQPVKDRGGFAAAALLATPAALRKIRFVTSQFALNHVVTVCSAVDGWTSDTFGT
jgi:hypothetical protein